VKPYRRPFPNTWWLMQRSYFFFMVREVTSVFVAGYCIFLLIFVYKLSQGPEAYEKMIKLLESPVSITLHVVAFIFVIYHSVTWFNLTPKIFVLRIGEKQVPPYLISGANFAGWLIISAILAWVILVV